MHLSRVVRLVTLLVSYVVLFPVFNVVAVDQAEASAMFTPHVDCAWTHLKEVNAWFAIHFWYELMPEIFQAWPHFPSIPKSHSVIIIPVELLLFCDLLGGRGVLRRVLGIECLGFNLPFGDWLVHFVFFLIDNTRDFRLLIWVWDRYFYDLGTYFRLILILKQEF
jgi:hypothetical protein